MRKAGEIVEAIESSILKLTAEVQEHTTNARVDGITKLVNAYSRLIERGSKLGAIDEEKYSAGDPTYHDQLEAQRNASVKKARLIGKRIIKR